MFVQSELVNTRAEPQSVVYFFVLEDSVHKLKLFLGGNIISVPTSEPLSHFVRFCDFKADIEGFRSSLGARSTIVIGSGERGLSLRGDFFLASPLRSRHAHF